MSDDNSDSARSGQRELARRLAGALHLGHPPIAISFLHAAPDGVGAFDEPMSEPAPDGRAGRVPAGCVFWVRAATRAFSTVPADHGNCSVGRFTHGLASLEDVAGNGDVAALLESGWVTPEAVAGVPSVSERAEVIAYGPLPEVDFPADVVLMRVNGRQMMVLSDAMPGLRIEGKPQCHIVAIAKEQGEVAASVGCALSRARTGMKPEEMTVAVPGARLAEVVEAVERTAAVDGMVAKYAADDARRFAAGA
ncbi:MAG TPA: DUF169 domain-containing protein [Acidimicrobiales bacterium]|nr:DUF169 domain-containing protein [Acidimicrobiales bacterium]